MILGVKIGMRDVGIEVKFDMSFKRRDMATYSRLAMQCKSAKIFLFCQFHAKLNLQKAAS